jgi:hypothetical protein
VIRVEQFRVSKRLYAVKPETFLRRPPMGQRRWSISIDAVWFRRQDGRTRACYGTLYDHQDERPESFEQFLERFTDGRYGGDCLARWDGEKYWGSQTPAVIERDLALLRPALENYPAAPAGYVGWWRFETSAEQAELNRKKV